MKKLLVGLVLLLTMGCGGKAIKKDLCTEVQEMPLPEQYVAYNMKEYNEYMYSVGQELAWKMNLPNPCAYVNILVKSEDQHLMGKICTDIRDDGLHLCEKICIFTAEGKEKGRLDRCQKVSN
jgi:hypothetical protein